MRKVSRARLLFLISAFFLLIAAIPAMASPIYSSGSYSVSGTLDNQYFGGTIGWSGNKVTSYNLSFGGQGFSCSSQWGACSAILTTINTSGFSGLLAGFFSPNGSPFTYVTAGKGHQTYWTNMTWSYVAVPEESALMQVACLLGLFALVIPRARLLRQRS